MKIPRRSLLMGLGGLASSACSKLAFVAVNLPASFGAYTRHNDLAYGPDLSHRLDVYVPDAPSVVSRPVVVFYYGGRWETGDKAEYRFVGATLASLGCVAVLPNYRHYPEVKMPGYMEDVANAAQWASEHAAEFGADPAQFFLMGHSAGAHLAALVALDRRYFRATGRPVPALAGVIGLSGPYDFLPLTDPDLKDMFGPPERYPDSQPIHFARPDAPPMLLIHGLADDSVWPKNSINLAAALRALGVSVTLNLLPKLGHTDTVAALSIPARGRAPTVADIKAFLLSQAVNPPRSS